MATVATTWAWRPSSGQWNTIATLGFDSRSRALRVQRAEVKTRESGSIRFRLTVRAEGRPSASAVANVQADGSGTPASRASSIQPASSRSGSGSMRPSLSAVSGGKARKRGASVDQGLGQVVADDHREEDRVEAVEDAAV